LPGRELHPLEAPGFAWRTKTLRNIDLQQILRPKFQIPPDLVVKI
jgi:hypothetical protein